MYLENIWDDVPAYVYIVTTFVCKNINFNGLCTIMPIPMYNPVNTSNDKTQYLSGKNNMYRLQNLMPNYAY